MKRHPILASVPDELLRHSNSNRLVRWLETRGHRPLLIHIEQERRDRGIQ